MKTKQDWIRERDARRDETTHPHRRRVIDELSTCSVPASRLMSAPRVITSRPRAAVYAARSACTGLAVIHCRLSVVVTAPTPVRSLLVAESSRCQIDSPLITRRYVVVVVLVAYASFLRVDYRQPGTWPWLGLAEGGGQS